jgi:cobalt/nickel transport system ATP-binding protein
MEEAVIKVKDLNFNYSDGTQALKNVSFNIKKGERVAFIGSNGAGKSTLFLHLNGILMPLSGEVIINNIPIIDDKKALSKVRQNLGLVFQNPDDQLFAPTVFEDVAFGPMNMGLSKEEVDKLVYEAIKRVGMEGFEKKPPHHLSGGQKKRVAIAGVLAMKPTIMALDEPTAGLDPQGVADIMKILSDLNNEGMTIIITTHDVDLIPLFTNKVFVMHHGALVAEGTPEKIFSQPELLKEAHLRLPLMADLLYKLKQDGVSCNIRLTVKEAHDELLQVLGKNIMDI